MTDSDDNWPQYRFDPGPPKCLHAVAVISGCYNTFERLLFDLYSHHLDRKKYHRIISEKYFLSIDEKKRVELVKEVFRHFEKRRRIIEAIDNLMSYFTWCVTVRNSILHAEVYPAFFASTTDLNLVKRLSKRSAKLGYLSLDLATLRYLADRIEDGRLQAAKINLHLRYRDTAPSRRSPALRHHGREPLPQKLPIPAALTLSERPHSGPKPQYQRHTS
jgi:hypothetical protein